MGAGQDAGFGNDWTNRYKIAAINALFGIQNVPANDFRFDFLEHTADQSW